MTGGITLIYVVIAICFILALNGLSSQATARRGNYIAIGGMIVAICITVIHMSTSAASGLNPDAMTYVLIVVGILIGGAVGTAIALRIEMKSMPQLVAAFHSLVGLVAVFIAAAAFYAPEAYGIGTAASIHTASLIEMSLGAAIGGITFTGSIVAFTKLQGLVNGAAVVFKGQHFLNLVIGLVIASVIPFFRPQRGPSGVRFLGKHSLNNNFT